jgi:hypothetical protein
VLLPLAQQTTGVQPGRDGGCLARSAAAARPCDREDPDGYASWWSSTTAIRAPITAVAGAAAIATMSTRETNQSLLPTGR